ncbi:hypothetical protein [Ornithinimicrobium kibberense]|uniref:hypothetical protein n=1 Tax=Ornithinimicrobium kibberense TaxID=282060 RepID=UPI0036193B96
MWPEIQGPPESPGITRRSANKDHTQRLGRLMSPEPSPIHCQPTLLTVLHVHPVWRPILQTGSPRTAGARPVIVTLPDPVATEGG